MFFNFPENVTPEVEPSIRLLFRMGKLIIQLKVLINPTLSVSKACENNPWDIKNI
jgi:hypothetical protein